VTVYSPFAYLSKVLDPVFSNPWPGSAPLRGLTIVLTRERRKADSLAGAFERLGASVVACPTIEIADPEDPTELARIAGRLEEFHWIVFTSANGVERAFDQLTAAGLDAQQFGRLRIAAVGPATAEAARLRGLHVDVVPEAYVAESLFEALGTVGPLHGSRILLARASIARDVLPDALRNAGALVEVVDVYRTITPEGAAGSVSDLLEADLDPLITFTSSSTAEKFAALSGGRPITGIRAACIGPVTAAAARACGFSVVAVASSHTTAGLVESVVRWATAEGGHGG